MYLRLVEGGQTWQKIDRSGHLRGRPLPSSGKDTAEDDDDEQNTISLPGLSSSRYCTAVYSYRSIPVTFILTVTVLIRLNTSSIPAAYRRKNSIVSGDVCVNKNKTYYLLYRVYKG